MCLMATPLQGDVLVEHIPQPIRLHSSVFLFRKCDLLRKGALATKHPNIASFLVIRCRPHTNALMYEIYPSSGSFFDGDIAVHARTSGVDDLDYADPERRGSQEKVASCRRNPG